jgi:rhamnosyltransferase
MVHSKNVMKTVPEISTEMRTSTDLCFKNPIPAPFSERRISGRRTHDRREIQTNHFKKIISLISNRRISDRRISDRRATVIISCYNELKGVVKVAKSKKVIATIIIPTRNNPGDRLELVLDKIFTQDFKSFEVIVIDSGSTDLTYNLVRGYPIRFVKIKPSEFGHGKTRNYGAELAKGKYIIYLTADAIPKNNSWLTEMIKPFSDNKVAAIYGRQLPKEEENILDKLHYAVFYGHEEIEWTAGSYTIGDNIFSDVCSALRKELISVIPYKKDIIVSEDHEWANRILQKGYKVIYQPKAEVIHSHSFNFPSLFKKCFDIGVSYKYITNFNSNISFIKKATKLFIKEVTYLNKIKKPYLILNALGRGLVKAIAINLGKNESIFPNYIKRNYLSAQSWYWE